MPIIDVTLVTDERHAIPPRLAQRVADQLGSALGLSTGHLWVRLHILPAMHYAENGMAIATEELPAFVQLLHSRPPTGDALAREAALVSLAVGSAIGRDPSRIHVEYAPPGMGRMAFGGQLASSATGMESYFILYVADQQRSRQFYEQVLGLQPRLDAPGMTEFALPAGGVLGLMPENGIRLLLGEKLPDPARAQGIPRAELYLLVAAPGDYHARARAAGGVELSALQARDWGHAAAYVLDPDGHVLAFATPLT